MFLEDNCMLLLFRHVYNSGFKAHDLLLVVMVSENDGRLP